VICVSDCVLLTEHPIDAARRHLSGSCCLAWMCRTVHFTEVAQAMRNASRAVRNLSCIPSHQGQQARNPRHREPPHVVRSLCRRPVVVRTLASVPSATP